MAKKSWTIFLLAAGSMAATTAGGDETRPAVVPPPAPLRPMPDHYNVLLTRSIFSKDSRPAPAVHATAKIADGPSASAPEADYVLRGVGVADGQPTAFFELTSEHKIVLVHLGDPVLHGSISAGSLDGVDYVVGGKASHIIIGQSLDGGISVTAPTATVSSAPAAEITPTQKKWIKKHHQD
jgi:hypothetical protein